MKINGTPPLPPALSGTTRGTGTVPSLQTELPENELVYLENARVQFGGSDPLIRRLRRDDWTRDLNDYLSSGYLEQDSDAVDREVASATHSAGVASGLVNLVLHENTFVFGFLDCDQLGDTYYVYQAHAEGTAYYAITIESGAFSGGVYDIFVTQAMDWATFKASLPAM